ncbi:MAG: dephospho-CoA kinase [Gammaproteobacteria bacterium]|nr:dephospho-CoA kinase [Gammaproteobacteria bacterium]|tara:strand:+ start:431 stop:1006 length:576 start_codon:yes stop_codon:yes gene_type:complete
MSTFILTGHIGSGKTLAKKILENKGAYCICADEIVRELYKRPSYIKKIKDIVPEAVKKNKVNRNILREAIFSNKLKKSKIENIVQKDVLKKIKSLVERNKNKDLIIVILPIIGITKIKKYNGMILIKSYHKIRVKRLLKRKFYSKETIKNIISYQRKIDSFSKNADFVINNNLTKEHLKNQLNKLYKEIKK